MTWISTLLYFVYIQLDSFICCPAGYVNCNLENGGTCPAGAMTQDHGEVAFGTDVNGIWTYKSLSPTALQRDCTETEFGDTSPANTKECCLTNLTDSIASNVVGEMSCGDTTKVWFRDEINRRYWKLTTTQVNDITYYGCNTGFDSTTTVYNSSQIVISNAQCLPNMDGYGNNCGNCVSSNREEFTLNNQVAGVYWIRIGYFSDTSDAGNKIYELSITCNPITITPTTVAPTTYNPTTNAPTTFNPTTSAPTTFNPTTNAPTTSNPTFDPTNVPTADPTSHPTSHPTTDPTIDPTRQPLRTNSPSTYPSMNPSGDANSVASTEPTYADGRSVDETTKNPGGTENEDTWRDNDSGFDYLLVIIYTLAVLIGLCCIGAIIMLCFIHKRRKQNQQAKIDQNLENGSGYILETSPTITTTTASNATDGKGEAMCEVQLNTIHNHSVENDMNETDTDEEQMDELYVENVTKGGENEYQQNVEKNILDENASDNEQEEDFGGLYEKGRRMHVTAGDKNNFDSPQTAGYQNSKI